MKAQTIHTNPMGEVLNVTSATGFRVEESPGRIVELRTETGRAVLHVGHYAVSVQFITDMLEQQVLIERMRLRDELAEENCKFVDAPTVEDLFGSPKDFDHGTKGDW